MNILVTGATGLLGKPLMQRLARSHTVSGIARRGQGACRECDLTDEQAIGRLFHDARWDVVVHAAAFSDVDGCERDPDLAYRTNALATKFLSQRCAESKKTLIYVSTDYVFNGLKGTPYEPADPTCPVNVYGLTKLAGEYFVRSLAQRYAVVRTSWLFGAGNPLNFVNAIWERMKNQKEVHVLDDQIDAPTFVEDLAEAIEKIIKLASSTQTEKGSGEFREIFQVCNQGSVSRYGMTLEIKKMLNLAGVTVQRLDSSKIANRVALRPRYAVMSTRYFENKTGMVLRSWQESLREYLTGKV